MGRVELIVDFGLNLTNISSIVVACMSICNHCVCTNGIEIEHKL